MGLEIPAWRARNAFVSYISRPRHLSPHYLWQMHAFYRTFAFKVPWVTEVVVFSARGGIFRGRPKAKATSGAWVTLKTLLKTEAAHETLADPHLQIFWSKNKGGGAAPPPPPGPLPWIHHCEKSIALRWTMGEINSQTLCENWNTHRGCHC